MAIRNPTKRVIMEIYLIQSSTDPEVPFILSKF
jgi:hypothetical protein